MIIRRAFHPIASSSIHPSLTYWSTLRPIGCSYSSSSSSTSPSSGPSFISPVLYCKQQVQKFDHEAYLASYFFPAGRPREAFWALRALNMELATIPETVSNVAIGQIRMQFWRDVIRDISNGIPPSSHPIANALAMTSDPKTVDLTAYYLNQMLDAREESLGSPPYPTLTQLLVHLSQTQTPMTLLSLSLVTPNPTPTSQSALQHLSLSTGLASLLLSLPFHASNRKLPAIPLDIASRCGLVAEELFRKGHEAKGLDDAVFEVACRARDELETAKLDWKDKGKIPKAELPVYLSAVSVESYLDRLQAANFNPFEPSLQKPSWRTPLDVWLMWRRRTI
ncbi:Phytoene/squalene synthetase [Phaffia rhodozyma]|uniref:Phytoene/squalene synthetase n=1 Tax=Phaffia rhodozyma TaxID=264483 RepID=A0A0F7SYE2_PHARH|nr:Phytoene/squalene synthetase [Phaffia rhodozyma]